MHVEDVRMTSRRTVERGELVPVAQDADMPHVDPDFAVREAAAGDFGILRVAGVEIARLQPADGLDVLEPLQPAAHLRERCVGHSPPRDRSRAVNHASSRRVRGACGPWPATTKLRDSAGGLRWTPTTI